MIDLHSHVLPGIDDGPEDESGSIAMAEVAVDCGTTVLAATPHIREDHPRVRPEELAGRVAALQRALDGRGIALRIVTGGELGLGEALALDDETLRTLTLAGNGRDLLVESPWAPLPSIFEDALDGLARRGFRVVLAHPELNPTFQQQPERLGRLGARGVLVQITAISLTSSNRAVRRVARAAVEHGWAHLVASDAHSATWRPPDLAGAVEAAREALPDARDQLDWLAAEGPAAVLAGEDLPGPPPPASRARGVRRLLGRRG